jgi:hypothetical protein
MDALGMTMGEQPRASAVPESSGDAAPGGATQGATLSTTDDRPGPTFTRDDLDAAEPERPPSFRRRWLVGFVLGSVGGVVAGWGLPVNPVGLLALPWTFTPAGAGALVGAGSFLASLLLVTGGGALGTEMDATTAALVAVTFAFLPIGLVGTVVASRRRGDR